MTQICRELFFTDANSVGVSYRGRPSVVEPKNIQKMVVFWGELDGDIIKHQSKKIEVKVRRSRRI